MFHVPDVLPEHVEKIFKDFDKEQVNKIFPPGYFKLSELFSPEKKPNSAAVIVDLENDGEEETENIGKSEKGKDDKVVDKEPTQSSFGECPLCGEMFPMKELEEHAQDCSQEAPHQSIDLGNSIDISDWTFVRSAGN